MLEFPLEGELKFLLRHKDETKIQLSRAVSHSPAPEQSLVQVTW